jgi:NAD(P)-dependent dehydrogenase (short-subunit alcohol dehydrogenase family)
MDLEDKVAIVTGGSSGIGQGIAREFARCGTRVAILDVNDDEGEAVTSDIGGLYVHTDVTEAAQIDASVARVRASYGRLDVLVNCAGVTGVTDIFDVTPEFWDRIMAINARGTFFTLQSAARVMRSDGTGGSVVNISSIAGKGYRNSSSVAYSASKAAVIGLTRTASLQLAPFDIRVNAICPGVTVTPTLKSRLFGEPTPETEARWQAIVSSVPLGRVNAPVNIAAAAVFLASDSANTITGQSLNVDGGIVFD